MQHLQELLLVDPRQTDVADTLLNLGSKSQTSISAYKDRYVQLRDTTLRLLCGLSCNLFPSRVRTQDFAVHLGRQVVLPRGNNSTREAEYDRKQDS